MPPDEASGYDGPARLLVGGASIDAVVHLDGHLEPLDGHFHWYGRIERSDDLAALKDGGATAARLVVADGPPAELRLAGYDAWGHVQVNGTGAPPYPLDAVEVDVPRASVS